MKTINSLFFVVVSGQISALLAKIEKQKRELASVKDNIERSPFINTDEHSSDPLVHKPRHDPSSQVHIKFKSSLPHKKRKIATAPPPKSYTGFTSTLTEPVPIKTHVKKVSHLTTSANLLGPVDNQTTKHERWAAQVADKPVITPSSWRSGQVLANKILSKTTKSSTAKPLASSDHATSLTSPASNAEGLLQDLELSDDDEEDISEVEEKPKIPATKPVNHVKRVFELGAGMQVINNK